MKRTEPAKSGFSLFGKALTPRELLTRLVLAEVMARPGEGPLAPRFRAPKPAPTPGTPAPSTRQAAEEK